MLSFAAAPAFAQTAEAMPGDGTVAEDGLEDNDAPADSSGVPKKADPTWTIRAKFAPTVSGKSPLQGGERLTDYQTNSLSAEFKFPLLAGPRKGLGLDFVADAGLKHNLDVDGDSDEDDPRTAIYGNANFQWGRGVKRLSPFAGYSFEKGYTDFFVARAYVDHKLSAGMHLVPTRYVRGSDESMSFVLTAAVDRIWSRNDSRQRWTPRAAAELKGSFTTKIGWSLTAVGEYRRFDKIPLTKRRNDWRLSTFAGLDLAKWVDPDKRAIGEMKLGVRMTVNESNVDSKDFSAFNILPIITIGTTFPKK
jgi:hypothetical protein